MAESSLSELALEAMKDYESPVRKRTAATWALISISKSLERVIEIMEEHIDYEESLDHQQTISDARNAGCP